MSGKLVERESVEYTALNPPVCEDSSTMLHVGVLPKQEREEKKKEERERGKKVRGEKGRKRKS